MEKVLEWYAGSGRATLKLTLTEDDASIGSHPGPCDSDIADLMTFGRIRDQLNRMSPEQIKAELREYGAWEDSELSDHEANLSRILWIACGDLKEAR